MEVKVWLIFLLSVRGWVQVAVIVTVSEEDRDKATCEWLRERDTVHDTFIFEIYEGAKSQREWLQIAWSIVRIFEGSRIETLLELHQVDILVR